MKTTGQLFCFMLAICLVLVSALAGAEEPKERVKKVLQEVPLIDGHNDLPWQCHSRFDNHLERFHPTKSTGDLDPPMHTDFDRLKEGGVGGQFWSVYVPLSLIHI